MISPVWFVKFYCEAGKWKGRLHRIWEQFVAESKEMPHAMCKLIYSTSSLHLEEPQRNEQAAVLGPWTKINLCNNRPSLQIC